ncbi:MAG TPA: BTAD domain-containing putative transcriptional regulator [Frankiaceae bacterium]|jgi:DNA-binding SARP family transcriptional activator|nr:BTAD domain-containing putative transcriptional regulator [Frankiaceae bacterium]
MAGDTRIAEPRAVRRGTVSELRLLNGFEVRRDGRAVALPGSAERVVAYLAVHDGPVRRAQVASALWLDSTEEHAAASLRSALWRLRQAAGSLVTTTVSDVALGPDVAVDLASSTRLANAIVGGRALGDLGVASPVAALDEELLPGWYDDDWVVFRRERWRQLRLHALEALAALLASEGRFGEAVDAAFAAVRVEPLRESAHRALIGVHLAEGNRSEALREYAAFARMLRDELDVEPSPRLTALVEPLTSG